MQGQHLPAAKMNMLPLLPRKAVREAWMVKAHVAMTKERVTATKDIDGTGRETVIAIEITMMIDIVDAIEAAVARVEDVV